MSKRSQQDSEEERVTAKNATGDESHRQAVARIVLDFSKPGEEKLWKSTSLEFQLLRKRKRSGRLDKGKDLFEASDHHYHDQFMESFSSATYSKAG